MFLKLKHVGLTLLSNLLFRPLDPEVMLRNAESRLGTGGGEYAAYEENCFMLAMELRFDLSMAAIKSRLDMLQNNNSKCKCVIGPCLAVPTILFAPHRLSQLVPSSLRWCVPEQMRLLEQQLPVGVHGQSMPTVLPDSCR